MGEISNWGNCVARTPMYALAINRRFCPAAPMKKAPTTVLDSLHHCWGPNWHKTTLKQIQWCLMLGTLADDLSCPVPPPSLVSNLDFPRSASTYRTYQYVSGPSSLPRPRMLRPRARGRGSTLVAVIRGTSVPLPPSRCAPFQEQLLGILSENLGLCCPPASPGVLVGYTANTYNNVSHLRAPIPQCAYKRRSLCFDPCGIDSIKQLGELLALSRPEILPKQHW